MTSGWARWHNRYDDPSEPLAVRLRLVVDETRQAISRCAGRPIRLVSVCAGQGRDVVAALEGHSRRDEVSAILLELNAENVESARSLAREAGLKTVVVLQADASLTDTYAEYVPADVLLVCGVFGHLTEPLIRRAIEQLPGLCAPGATVIWTRHLGPPDGSWDLTPEIRTWFQERGFEERAFSTEARGFGVGAHQLVAPPQPYEPGRRLFHFRSWSGGRPEGRH
jgi:hypothetical protein